MGSLDLYLADRKPLKPVSNYVYGGGLWVPQGGSPDASGSSKVVIYDSNGIAIVYADVGTKLDTLHTDSAALLVNLIAPSKTSFTRPTDTTPYTANDLIANDTTAGLVVPLSFTGCTKTAAGGSGQINKLTGYRSDVTAATIRYHFLKTAHAVTGGDNAALIFTSLDVDNYIGSVDITFNGVNDIIGSGGGLVNQAVFPNGPLNYVLASGDTIYVFQQALVTFTPGNGSTYGIKVGLQVFS